ncbi:NAD-dependent epimerase/dehydratase family protein [Sporolactobacillus sp. Y61]|uniref:NAD-dependent epimerase/dehydratase family protein n=1 Tax=Sporolactobacillus sp. Y61 TaxID=3160863 RepID=A0AAU8IGY0_9BACL
MNILVTGAAGFIGSHLCEKLVENEQVHVTGVDTFIGPTPPSLKKANLTRLENHPRFTLLHENLLTADLERLLDHVDIVYHLAGMPGVRSSWGKDFDPYVTNNIQVTQRLLEAAKNQPLQKFIYASTSSVYGDKQGKVAEDTSLTPLSPYGLTKLAGEHLCYVYRKSFAVPVITVRFFTVYGPRQRPDMAFHRFIRQILTDDTITLYGDGHQSRDFTYIDDCIAGLSAMVDKDGLIGKTINIGGKERATINETLAIIEQLTGKKAAIEYLPALRGEPKHTWADISNAQTLLDYDPRVALREGLACEIAYIRSAYAL